MPKIFALIISAVIMLSSCAVLEAPKKISLTDIGRQIKEKLGTKEGSIIFFEADKENPTADEMDTVAELLEIRLKSMGYKEADITVRGDNSIRVEVPSLSDPEEVASALGQRAELKFYDSQGVDQATGEFIEGAEILSGKHIKDATARYGAVSVTGGASNYVQLEFTREGQKAFYKATKRNIGQPIYIVLDGVVQSAPVVTTAINDSTCVISGEFSMEEVQSLAAIIKSGQLPFGLTTTKIRTISD